MTTCDTSYRGRDCDHWRKGEHGHGDGAICCGLSYTGVAFDALGTTTFLSGYMGADRLDFDPGIYLLFNASSGNIVFSGKSTFNGGQTRGGFDGLAPMPLPAAAWLLIAGIGGLFAFGHRRVA